MKKLAVFGAIAIVAAGLAGMAWTAPPASASPTLAATATIPVGSGPGAVAVNPNTDTVYVANSGSNSVSVIDGATNTVTATTSVGSGPDGLAVNPNTGKVYVANSGSNTVSVLDGSTARVTATIALPGGLPPQAVGVDATTDRVYVSNGTFGGTYSFYGGTPATVSVIDGSTGQVTTTINLQPALRGPLDLPLNDWGPSENGLAVNPNTHQVYVSSFGGTDSHVSVIDGTTNQVTATVESAGIPKGAAVDASTDTGYVADWTHTELLHYDGTTGGLLSPGFLIAGPDLTGVEGVAVDAGTHFAYVTDDNGTMSVIDLAAPRAQFDLTGSQITATFAVGSGPKGVAVDPATVTVYVANSGSNTVSVLAQAPPSVAAGGGAGGYSGVEGAAIAVAGTASDMYSTTPATTWRATGNPGTDGTCTFANPAALSTTVTCTDEGSYTLTLAADDGLTAPVTSTATLTLGQVPIEVGPPGLVGDTGVMATAEVLAFFTDPAGADPPNTAATIDWGDGTTTPGTVDEFASGFGNVSGVHTYAAAGTYTVAVTVTDGDSPPGTGSASAQLTVIPNTAPSVDIGEPLYNGVEGSAITVSGTAADSDGDTVTTLWQAAPTRNRDYGICTFANPAALSTTVTCTDEGDYLLTLTASDGVDRSVTSTGALEVGNAPIAVGTITGLPAAGVAANTAVTASATFTDPGTVNGHTATIDWGDGTTTAATVTETLHALGVSQVGSGTGSASGSHSYAHAGVYTVTVSVSDTAECQGGTFGFFHGICLEGSLFPSQFGTSSAQVSVLGVPTAPTISNIPATPTFGGSFVASVSTNGDGTTSVTSSTPLACTVGGDGVTVSFVGVGTCTLTAHVAQGTNYNAADGTAQSFSVGQATPTTPTITNIPSASLPGGSFVASVSTTGDGTTSVTSSTPLACTVGGDGVTVSFVGVGLCSLTAHVAQGTNYNAADGSAQSFSVGRSTPTTPTISNLPASATFGGSFVATVSTTGDGTKSVTSSTPSACTVGNDGVTVSFVGLGTCSLTAHVALGTNYNAADGAAQSLSVGRATPTTPSITNIPASPTFGASFVASVSTNGDGTTSVTSSTPSVCTVGSDGLTVSFVGVGTCTLAAHVAQGTNYNAADGAAQTFSVGRGTPTIPSITNVPASPTSGGSFVASVSTNGDGTKSVTSSTPSACTVGIDHLTVTFVGVGTCTLTAHVAQGTNYNSADGSAQSFSVRATPTAPTIANIPASPTFGGSFVASVSTNGDGTKSVTSSTPSACTVGIDHLTVTFVGVGTCTLTAHVAQGTNYYAADGSAQSSSVVASQTHTALLAPSSVPFGQSFTVTATVSAVAPGGGTPTGSVQFIEGSTNLGAPIILGAGQASITVNMLLPGQSITASYLGTADYLASGGSATPTVTFSHPAVTGPVPSNPTYSGGTWLLSGATVAGSMTIAPSTSVLIMGSTVGGSIVATSPGSLTICGTTSGNAVKVSGASGFVLLGDPGDDGCAANTFHSSVTLTSNNGAAELIGNHIGGNALVTGTTGSGPFLEDRGAELEGNTIGGTLGCSTNTPIADDGNPNSVGGARSGQCTGGF